MRAQPSFCRYRQALDDLYERYNRREFIRPDPLQFVHMYDDPRDCEVVALLASALAYGRVAQIIRNVSAVLEKMGASPSRFLRQVSRKGLSQAFDRFKHRFTTGHELASLLWGTKMMVEEHGSLNVCFLERLHGEEPTVLPALSAFVDDLKAAAGAPCDTLLPLPARGSACKRLHLFLRWMVRRDDVDPGLWSGIPAAKLIVPLDTHMYRIGRALGFTKRNQPDLGTAFEITEAFRSVNPDDPVRYDFALTRFGIWGRHESNVLSLAVG